jgi:predicted DNA-binding protein YlxM (UPF0122 family)
MMSRRPKSERNQQIIDLRLAGSPLSSIGMRFGISKQAVHQIIKRNQILFLEYLEDMERLDA